jgi:hypothetical protein
MIELELDKLYVYDKPDVYLAVPLVLVVFPAYPYPG